MMTHLTPNTRGWMGIGLDCKRRTSLVTAPGLIAVEMLVASSDFSFATICWAFLAWPQSPQTQPIAIQASVSQTDLARYLGTQVGMGVSSSSASI